MRKERFPTQRKSKLFPRGDGNFQVVAKVNDNAYKIDLPGEYGVRATFNVADLTHFELGDEDFNSRSNSLQEGGSDEDQEQLEVIQSLGRLMTRSMARKHQESLVQFMTKTLGYQETWLHQNP